MNKKYIPAHSKNILHWLWILCFTLTEIVRAEHLLFSATYYITGTRSYIFTSPGIFLTHTW